MGVSGGNVLVENQENENTVDCGKSRFTILRRVALFSLKIIL
jgi:hypothetical protein